MFRCDHCNTEYGGIRGIAADHCPRCADKNRALQLHAASSTSSAVVFPASWASPQFATSSWSQPSSPSFDR